MKPTRRDVLRATAVLSLGTPMFGLADSRWRSASSLPLRIQEIYPCLHNGQIWVAGGLSPDVPEEAANVADRVVRYDIDSDTWLEAPSLPEPRHHGFLVSMHQELYLFGGFVAANGGRWSASRDVLKLEADKWIKIAETPAAQTETVSAVYQNQIHFAGGRAPIGISNENWSDQQDVETHQIFNIETLETTTAAPLPVARNSAASFVVDKQWHIVGGRTVNGGNSDRHDIYDFEQQTWRRGAPLPQAQGGLAAAAIGKHGYVFGGEYFSPRGGGVYAEVWHYDAEAEGWFDAGVMPVPRHGLGAVAVGSDIYVVAGATEAGGRGTSDRMSVFSWSLR